MILYIKKPKISPKASMNNERLQQLQNTSAYKSKYCSYIPIAHYLKLKLGKAFPFATATKNKMSRNKLVKE
jgi:hypothetical protein